VEEKMESQNETTKSAPSKLRRGLLYGLLGAGGLAALFVVFAARPIMAAIQDGAGFHRPWRVGWGHHAMNPEAAKEHLQIASKWALRDIDASPAQQDQVNRILAGAVDDLFRMRQKHQSNREAFAAQLGGATIDRAALEEIRKSEMALADEASQKFVQALADVADVLTPEQRRALIEHVHQHHR
jgi:periplasmic protein CpxP/Spy